MECNADNEGSKKRMSKQIVAEDNICRQCFESGQVIVTGQLPYGLAMQCTHDNGAKHTWTKYNSLASLGARKTGDPLRIRCPKCKKMGMLNYYRPKANRTDRVNYLFRHERIKGTWGKDKIHKVRRCYIRDEEGKAKIRSILEEKGYL
jgi:hypothetical protein